MRKAYMCGIYAVIKTNTDTVSLGAETMALQGLKRIEYRGYDSWGIAVVDKNKIKLHKQVGHISDSKSVTLPQSQVAIGHTRWATHGGVTKINAHPHLASDGSFALVQNGVVENYQELKSELVKKGRQFLSQTDTEVIVRLIEDQLPLEERITQDKGKYQMTVKKWGAIFAKLAGRSTIAVMTKAGAVIAYRHGSPLVLGRGSNIFVISSDVLSISEAVSEYTVLDNGQLVLWDGHAIKLFEASTGTLLQPKFKPITQKAIKLDTGGYEHFMLKEIYEQPLVWEQVLKQPTAILKQAVSALQQAPLIVVTAAGGASYAAGYLSVLLREQGLPVISMPAYEMSSWYQLSAAGIGRIHQKPVVIAISQSGETADTVEVIEELQKRGVTVISLVNMAGSTLSRMANIGFMLQVGPEIGVASTKALTGQMLWAHLLLAKIQREKEAVLLKKVKQYQQIVKAWIQSSALQTALKTTVDFLQHKNNIFLLGRGRLYYSAFESALKLKEISYIHAEAFSGGELKHGMIALVESGTPVACLMTDDVQKAAMLNAAAEVKARGAHVIGVAPSNNELFDEWLPIPPVTEFAAISTVLPFQLLTYYLALKKGLNPDKPRNLAKSVTVK